jgi:cell division initiation protein
LSRYRGAFLAEEAALRITPLDVRNHTFPKRFSGYACDEVDSFLGLIADDYEGLLREAEELRKNVISLEVRVEDLASNETILQDTLTMAQRMSESLKQVATKEAEVLLGEAEIRAEKVLDAAHRRASKLAGDLREMKQLRTRLSASVRAAIQTHLGILEGLTNAPDDEPSIGDAEAFSAPIVQESPDLT